MPFKYTFNFDVTLGFAILNLLDGKAYTLLTAPMSGFYNSIEGEKNPGQTQMRIAYVESLPRMELIAEIFAKLFAEYEAKRGEGKLYS